MESLQSVFDICDVDKDDQGLTLIEVQRKNCKDLLTSFFGITDDEIIKDFEAVDKNGDGLLSKQETSLIFEQLRYAISLIPDDFRDCDPNAPYFGAAGCNHDTYG